MSKFPWFKFYPSDWLSNPELRGVSLEARGAWIELTCVSFDLPQRGVFKSGGQAWTLEQITNVIVGDRPKAIKAVRELLRQGILRKSASGEYFCPRVVKDEMRRNYDSDLKRKKRSGDK